MSSVALTNWRNDRMPRPGEIERQSAACLAATPANTLLAEENSRALVVSISAHFQGFCRDLYAEAAQVIVSKIRPTLRALMLAQFTNGLQLDRGNPTLSNLQKDFGRFDVPLKLDLDHDPSNELRLQHLGLLNTWRNIAAHQGSVNPSLRPLELSAIRSWLRSCDELAGELDRITYNHLRRLLRRNPW